jgi:hypothetical protein
MAFSKLKAHLREASSRNWQDLLHALDEALGSFTPNHCTNFFKHAHYTAI